MFFLKTLISLLLVVVADVFTVRGVRGVFPQFSGRHARGIRTAVVAQAVFALVVTVSGFLLQYRVHDYRWFTVYYYLFGLLLVLYGPKLLFVVSFFADMLFFRRKQRHIFAKCGIAASIVLTAFMVWGVFCGRFDYRVERISLTCNALPDRFDGFRIVQLSDLHAGGMYGYAHRLVQMVDIVNEIQPDVIAFTGDFVNNFAEELPPVIPVLSRLRAEAGKFAILGNHDYGGYSGWASPADSVQNQRALEGNISLMGFRLLKNEAVVLEKDSANRIAIVGVENWGTRKRKNYPRRGDIVAATSVSDVPFKILLSHDPTFWQQHINGKTTIQLTLSGHTHGTQMGIWLGKKRFSPLQIMFPYWAGLYSENGQYLYVNNGVGVIGFPGRIGMPPEITVIELKKPVAQ
ncbi:MAG: metallophosphoesterase [Bacteroidales bacterium]|jgi:predicted MPP superfamily phosphohydrolase|nr:metallophosphoesterase [Bacteroidales bacterium]